MLLLCYKKITMLTNLIQQLHAIQRAYLAAGFTALLTLSLLIGTQIVLCSLTDAEHSANTGKVD